MTIIAERLPEIVRLDRGGHNTRDDGLCLLEAVAYIAGEDHTDQPTCVSPVLAAYGRGLNDALPDERRQELIPLAAALVGTAGQPDADRRRGLIAMDWLVRTYLPAWLRLVPSLTPHADGLEALPELTSWDDVERVTRETLSPARSGAVAARVAARDAAGPAAWDAARAAAGDAAWPAAGEAAGAAARVAAGEAAGPAARVATWDAAGPAAWDAAWAAAGAAARDAVWPAAWGALQSTVIELQGSAVRLFRRMIEVQP